MLEIEVPDQEFFDDEKQVFIKVKGAKLQLEHSLISISKWESKFHKPFLGKEEKTDEETLAYVRYMIINKNVDDSLINAFTVQDFSKINEYIKDSMTATTFYEPPGQPGRSETITSELIYYWMVAKNIPMECQKWHLNRLLTLIRVCSIKNAPPKKRNLQSLAAQRMALNAQRRKELGTSG